MTGNLHILPWTHWSLPIPWQFVHIFRSMSIPFGFPSLNAGSKLPSQLLPGTIIKLIPLKLGVRYVQNCLQVLWEQGPHLFSLLWYSVWWNIQWIFVEQMNSWWWEFHWHQRTSQLWDYPAQNDNWNSLFFQFITHWKK